DYKSLPPLPRGNYRGVKSVAVDRGIGIRTVSDRDRSDYNDNHYRNRNQNFLWKSPVLRHRKSI
ncbi:hypothetical protein, partial [Kamptonema sp. PCC 6506]|uniref:hypothetical protein n=1 Tax=Kamptonema sp. PCC 6506 TaxID=272129 RepID=UPI001F2FF326